MALRQSSRSAVLVLVCLILSGLRARAEPRALRSPVKGDGRILQGQMSSTSSSSIAWASGSSQSAQVYNHNDDPIHYTPDDGDTPTAMIIILAVVGAVVLVAIVGVAFIKRHNRKALDRMSSCELGIDSMEEIHYWRRH